MTINLKQALYELCQNYVEQKAKMARKGIKDAQDSANNETKSSAGDKYETGRAMMHLEKEKYARQLAQAIQLQEQLSNINATKVYEVVQSGALVSTSNGVFFIAISAGKLTYGGNSYFALSLAAPIAQAIKGLKIGDKGVFRGKTIEVKDII